MKMSKRLLAVCLCLILIVSVVPVPAHAARNSRTKESETPTEPTQPESTEPASGGLTPEGNLTLVDDTKDKSSGKEFITVVTKSGNYFYIIIDRDADGNATVHFLNLVDEQDLLALLSEEEVLEYQEEQAEKPTAPTKPEPEQTKPTEPDPTEPAPTKPDSEFDPQIDRETMIMLALPIVVLIVGGFSAYFVFGRKKIKSSPASQSIEDDWDYDYDLPEENDDTPNDY